MITVGKNRVWVRVTLLGLPLLALVLLALGGSRQVLAQGPYWSFPEVISKSPTFSWFPDFAVDAFDRVHVVWSETTLLETGRHREQVYYTRWDGESWYEPNDIVPPSADIERSAIAADPKGNLHLLFGGSAYNSLSLYYQRAPLGEAWSAQAWSKPHRVNRGSGYMGDIAVDSAGVIHLVYDDTIPSDDEDALVRADVFYRRSADGGGTWSKPINLFAESFTGSARPAIEIDGSDVIHVTWDEGWDRLSEAYSDTYHGVYMASSDGGQTWTSPTVIDYPAGTAAQLTVGSDGAGGVMLVWRSRTLDEIYYQWSTDGGGSWNPPTTIPGIFSRPWVTNFDMYDMAADSAGNIHLLIVGRESLERNALLGVYHLVWNGDDWSPPNRVWAWVRLRPQYPKILVHEGNQLHALWFTRDGMEWEEGDRQVWYVSSESAAPHQPVTPIPTLTSAPPTATPRPTATATPYPTLTLHVGETPTGLDTESDDILRLVVGLSPVAVVLLVVVAFKKGPFERLRR